MKMSSKEIALVLGIAFVIMAISSIPYIYGMILENRDWAYLGLNSRAPGDTNVYLSMIEQVRQGRFLLSNLFTPEHGKAILFHPLWLEMGWLSSLMRLSAWEIFQIERIVAGLFFLLLTWSLLIQKIFFSVRDRVVAFFLLTLSSGFGFGFFFMFVGRHANYKDYLYLVPMDLWVSESITFLTLYHSALFILSQAALVFLLVRYTQHATKNQTVLWGWGAIFAALVLMHPYDAVTVGGVVVVMEILVGAGPWKDRFQRLLTAVLPSLVVVAYYFFGVLREPSIGGWSQQNINETPVLRNVIFGYGVLWPFVLLGSVVAWCRGRALERLLVVWATVVGVLIFVEQIPFSRRLTNGWHIPLSLLAGLGWLAFWEISRNQRREMGFWIIAWLCGGLMILTPLSILVNDMMVLKNQIPPFFISRDILHASTWLRDHTTENDVILSHPYTGNILPAYSGRRVYIGHGHQTIDWANRLQFMTEKFYTLTPSEQKRFYQENDITVVVTTPEDSDFGPFIPGQGLEFLFQSGDVRVFRVPAK